MGAITKTDADRAGAFMREFWPFMKRFWYPEPNDKFWSDFVDAGNELGEKYIDLPIAKALIIAYMKEVENAAKTGLH